MVTDKWPLTTDKRDTEAQLMATNGLFLMAVTARKICSFINVINQFNILSWLWVDTICPLHFALGLCDLFQFGTCLHLLIVLLVFLSKCYLLRWKYCLAILTKQELPVRWPEAVCVWVVRSYHSWTWYFINALRKLLHIWQKHPLWLNNSINSSLEWFYFGGHIILVAFLIINGSFSNFLGT